ncbi:MAG: response regulator [Gemmatimonadota bacterium]
MNLNVLVVDDSSVMRSMIIRTLQMTGISIGELHQAGNGSEALEILNDSWVDLAIVDINMPVMNGEELIFAIREDPLIRDLSVVVVSTESSAGRIERLREKGVDFVHKPFTPERLRETILKVTGVSDVQTCADVPAGGGVLDF